MNRIIITTLIFLYIIGITNISAQIINTNQSFPRIDIFQKLEVKVQNDRVYPDPFRDVELYVQLKHQDGKVLNHFGFYDGDEGWKFRFSPDELGKWKYIVNFSDGSEIQEGAFICQPSTKPGRIQKNRYNPFWLGKGNESKTLFRSFHVGDRFFAENWDDPQNENDGNERTMFLNWLQENKYNMLSIASLFTNREEEGRGLGWDTPQLWPLNVEEYRKLEVILEELAERDITVFPFAGFFGAKGEWPTEKDEQELYIKYTLARIGHFPNIIWNVAGPEPFWREQFDQYKGAMRLVDIDRLGRFIDEVDIHNHIITVHNEKRATRFGDPFIDYSWNNMSTLQGPTTRDRLTLFSGLVMNHRPRKTCYAQETLWYGNINHPDYSDDDIRKNAYTILFSGSILGFADMNGNSSSGYSGTMDFEDLHQDKHDIVGKVWDWFETIAFHKMTTRQDITRKNTFCLANEGVEYYIYFDTNGEDRIHLDFPYSFETEWINARNPDDIRRGKSIKEPASIKTPDDNEDWIFHAWAPKPEIVANGHFPDLDVDSEGNIHLVYHRDGLKYRKYNIAKKAWEEEMKIISQCELVERSDPDIVVDRNGNPAVYCGKEFAWYDGEKWNKNVPGSIRDTELAIDSKDNIYLVHRSGNNGGNIGLKMFSAERKEWVDLTDPDQKNKGLNDHVYSDIFIDRSDKIHLVQRHGPSVEVTYRKSDDNGVSWPVEEEVNNERAEAPHIVVNSKGVVYISTGKGYCLERTGNDSWNNHGRKLDIQSRMQPELGIDELDNVYMTSWGGHYNILYKDVWLGEKKIDPVTENAYVGFVETTGLKDFAYIVWEEGNENGAGADSGLSEDSKIIVGILYPDGRLIGLY